ncbi:MAG: tryptophan synthase subunit alpha, partial [Caldimicrobium sp.]
MQGVKLIEKAFLNFKQKNKTALIPYITAFDPDKGATLDFLNYLAEAEPVCIELGFPFSDPIADGPTIQKAMVRALKNKPTFEEYLNIVHQFRIKYPQIPVICMTYYNILYKYGLEKCIKDAMEAQLDGFIIPDLPMEEASPWLKLTKNKEIATIFLAAPTSDETRIKKIAKLTKGFLYYVSLTGITGVRETLPEDLKDRLSFVRTLVKKPLAVGFGISKPEHVSSLRPYADAMVVGSALVKIIEEKGVKAGKELYKFLKDLKHESY